jgi:ATP-dependent protease ClpP protease subunit
MSGEEQTTVRVLSDEQKKAQPLLAKWGIIILPEEINHEAYVEFSWALQIGRELHGDKPIELRCCGTGGGSRWSFAIADLIKRDGNIDGILIGEVTSGHSIIWSWCQRRYAYPLASLKVHQVYSSGWASDQTETDHRLSLEEHEYVNKMMIERFAEISIQGSDWWSNVIYGTHIKTKLMPTEELIDMLMAEPISNRDKA